VSNKYANLKLKEKINVLKASTSFYRQNKCYESKIRVARASFVTRKTPPSVKGNLDKSAH
jgi:hypothetical protein